MYLLNRYKVNQHKIPNRNFTFHNVSIKSAVCAIVLIALVPLHSTMYLLNLFPSGRLHPPRLPLHSTMYLLNPIVFTVTSHHTIPFTFHNVSIKSSKTATQHSWNGIFTFHNVSIKSQNGSGDELQKQLYIPQCIY